MEKTYHRTCRRPYITLTAILDEYREVQLSTLSRRTRSLEEILLLLCLSRRARSSEEIIIIIIHIPEPQDAFFRGDIIIFKPAPYMGC
jgi:hypothetical protein